MPESRSAALEIMEQLRESGFTHDFVFRDGAMICTETGKRYAAEDLAAVASYRFEGVSNPDDSSLMLALRATDGTGGVYMDAYGAFADPGATEFVAAIPDLRKEAEVMDN